MSVFDCYTSWKLFQSDELGVDFGFTYCIAAPLHTKYCLKINGCNQLLIDFLLSLSRCSVCEVQSPAMHRRQQTVPLPWTRRHQLTRRTGWIRFHTGLHSNRLLSSIKLIQSSASFHAKVAVYVIFDFLFLFFIVVCFYFALMCTQFILFHQNPCNSFLQHTCSPLARCVFWLCFVSFMSRHAQSLSFHTDILHAWKRNCE